MNEDYVSYEVAKLLKEKKFHWNCHVCYDPRGESKELLVQEGISNVCYSVVYAAQPSTWLRSGSEKRMRYISLLNITILRSMKL